VIDSILKFVGGPYVRLFSTKIAELFVQTFDEVCVCTVA
jgi:hypothetical protein